MSPRSFLPHRGPSLLVASSVVASCALFPDGAPQGTRGEDAGAGGRPGVGGAGDEAGGGGNAPGGGAPASGGMDGGSGRASAGGAEAFGDAATGGSQPDAGRAGAPGGDGGDGGDEAGVLEARFTATVADCLEAGRPNPDDCRTTAATRDGPNVVWVDIRVGQDSESTGYLRFDPGAALDGRTVLTARVEVTVAGFALSPGSAPELWEVAPFDRAALFSRTPARVGTSAIATVPGPLSAGETVAYSLPAALVAAPALHLSLVPVRADGVGFWNLSGMAPPTLVVTFR